MFLFISGVAALPAFDLWLTNDPAFGLAAYVCAPRPELLPLLPGSEMDSGQRCQLTLVEYAKGGFSTAELEQELERVLGLVQQQTAPVSLAKPFSIRTEGDRLVATRGRPSLYAQRVVSGTGLHRRVTLRIQPPAEQTECRLAWTELATANYYYDPEEFPLGRQPFTSATVDIESPAHLAGPTLYRFELPLTNIGGLLQASLPLHLRYQQPGESALMQFQLSPAAEGVLRCRESEPLSVGAGSARVETWRGEAADEYLGLLVTQTVLVVLGVLLNGKVREKAALYR